MEHPQANIVVTTTAGAVPGKLAKFFPDSAAGAEPKNADALFLSVGYLSEVKPTEQDCYWDHAVTAARPAVIIPVHWDDFTAVLPNKPETKLKPAKGLLGDGDAARRLLKKKAEADKIRVLDLDFNESITISDHSVDGPVAR